MEFAANLKRLRKAAKLSQEGLALACGWSGQSRVGNYESGFREPELAEIPIIASALGVQVGELFGEAPSHSQPMRLDPVMLAETHRALRKLEHAEGRKFSLEDENYAARFVELYEMRAAMSAHPTQDEWVEFGRKLAAIMTPTGGDDGRGGSVPAHGTGAKKVARGVRR